MKSLFERREPCDPSGPTDTTRSGGTRSATPTLTPGEPNASGSSTPALSDATGGKRSARNDLVEAVNQLIATSEDHRTQPNLASAALVAAMYGAQYLAGQRGPGFAIEGLRVLAPRLAEGRVLLLTADLVVRADAEAVEAAIARTFDEGEQE